MWRKDWLAHGHFLVKFQDGTVVESMDALFGLCRKKSAGSSVRPPLNGSLLFAEQGEVDNFVANYKRQRVRHKVDSVSLSQFLSKRRQHASPV